MLLPQLVTPYFMLPYIMLGNDELFPLTVGMQALVSVGTGNAPQFTHVVMGATISVVPIVALFLLLQRYWRNYFSAGAVKV